MMRHMRYLTDLGPIDGYVLNIVDKKNMDVMKVETCKSIQDAKKSAIKYLMSHKTIKMVHIDRYWIHDGYGERNRIEKSSGMIERTDNPHRYIWVSYSSNTVTYIDSNGKKI